MNTSYTYDPKTKTFTFSFMDRDTYLTFRRQWVSQYLELSKRIRETKLKIKEEMRKNHLVLNDEIIQVGEPWKHQHRLINLREQANIMLECIKQSKKWANVCYLKERERVDNAA